MKNVLLGTLLGLGLLAVSCIEDAPDTTVVTPETPSDTVIIDDADPPADINVDVNTEPDPDIIITP